MATVRIATFNVENLFARFRFNANIKPENAVREGWDVNETHFDEFSSTEKKITGQAIRAVKADVLCLQEVENVDTLKYFRTKQLRGFSSYPHVVGIDGNDPRLIDVAVLSKLPIVHVRTYQWLKDSPSSRSFTFSRDCLEVDVVVDGTTLTLFVNHFKSMMGGRAQTRARREKQARAVRAIVEDRFGANAGSSPFVICGDLNDYPETDDQGSSGLDELVGWDQVENVVDRLLIPDRWTHYFKGRRGRNAIAPGYHQLDYLLVSRSLAQSAANRDTMPEILRKGLPKRADRYPGPHFDEIGKDKPKASDHCPVAIDLGV